MTTLTFPLLRRPQALHPGRWAVAFLGYAVAARIGMLFMAPEPGVSLLWPAAAVAIAAAWWWGAGAAVAAGFAAAAMQLWMGQGAVAAAAIGLGVIVAATAAAAVLRRVDFRPQLARLRDVAWVLAVPVVGASAVSSVIGAGAMFLGGATRWGGFGSLWWLCWVAVLLGTLLLLPVLLTVVARAGPLRRTDVEFVALAGVTAASGWLVYSDALPPGIAMERPLSYVVFPVMIWAAVRMGPARAATLLFLHAVIAVAYTAAAHGPFAAGSLHESLLALHAHLAMLSVTTLLLVAVLEERRRAEAESRQYLRELAHAGRIGAMGEMAAGLAHELNQPLCAITTYSQASLRLARNDLDPDLRGAIERVAANAQRAGDIIRRMRGFVQKGEIETESVAINDAVREVIALVNPEITQSGVAVRLELGKALPPVMAAPIHIHQVLVNLMRNATEAMRAGPVEGRCLIVSTSQPDARTVAVAVADTGPGIPEDLLDRLFEPFVTGRRNGMGLGLSISRSIAENHGGLLAAGNRPEGGAWFRLELPIGTRETAP